MSEEQALREFYAASYVRLVGVVGAVSGDRDAAEEAVQDAFVRLMGRWNKVSRYDDPEAWVRKVALGYVSNRRRKAANGRRAAARAGQAPQAATAATEAEVDVDRALTALPTGQRAVLVLHRLGFDIAEVARELGIPEGTAKSRLARGRQTLRTLLREDVNDRV